MGKSLRFSVVLLTAILFSLTTFAQTTLITGNVRNAATKSGESRVSVKVKDESAGTVTDASGNFRLQVRSLPVVLVFSAVGYETQEITVSNSDSPVQVDFVANSAMGQEVVVSTTR